MAALLLDEAGDEVGDVEPPVEPLVGYVKEPVGLAVAETVAGRIVPVYELQNVPIAKPAFPASDAAQLLSTKQTANWAIMLSFWLQTQFTSVELHPT